MSDDELRKACEKFLRVLTSKDNDWKCCVDRPDAVDDVMAFARAQRAAGRAAGLEGASEIVRQYIDSRPMNQRGLLIAKELKILVDERRAQSEVKP